MNASPAPSTLKHLYGEPAADESLIEAFGIVPEKATQPFLPACNQQRRAFLSTAFKRGDGIGHTAEDVEFLSSGFAIEVFNVLGAGDAFMAGFLRGWLRDEPLARCCEWGNALPAPIVVSRTAARRRCLLGLSCSNF